jgi:hypothetical protein
MFQYQACTTATGSPSHSAGELNQVLGARRPGPPYVPSRTSSQGLVALRPSRRGSATADTVAARWGAPRSPAHRGAQVDVPPPGAIAGAATRSILSSAFAPFSKFCPLWLENHLHAHVPVLFPDAQ